MSNKINTQLTEIKQILQKKNMMTSFKISLK